MPKSPYFYGGPDGRPAAFGASGAGGQSGVGGEAQLVAAGLDTPRGLALGPSGGTATLSAQTGPPPSSSTA